MSIARRHFLAGAGALAVAAKGAVPGPIWDFHCHAMAGASPQERIERLLMFADRLGIERLCLSLREPLSEDPSPEDLTETNDEVMGFLKRYPTRTLGLVYLNPNHLEFSLREFDRCVRDGPMVGVKLWVARRCSSPQLDPIMEAAAEANVPVYQHTWLKTQGNGPGESTPYDVAELARRHPGATLVCGHTGGNWELGIRAVRDLKNVPLCLAGSDPTAGFVEMAVREVGPERIIYGSDVSGRSFASQLGKVLGADIPDSAKQFILGGNLRRLVEGKK